MMNALPSFAQLQPSPSGQSAAASPLSLITGESGGMGPFDALFANKETAALPIPTANGEHPAASGQFQDVRVIMQLLRSSQADATPDAAAAVLPNTALMSDPAANDTSLKAPTLPTTERTETRGGRPHKAV